MTSGIPWNYEDKGKRLIGELYRPTGAWNGKAVLVVHEADGIGGNVRRHSKMLSELGYLAAAADMHGAGRPLTGEEIGPALAAFKSDPDRLKQRFQAAYEALKAEYSLSDGEIAAIGYCFGGTTVLEIARAGASLAGVASFHGLLTTPEPAQPGAVRTRILACTGARDPLVPPDDLTAFEREMAEAGADWQLCVFGRALHSFTNENVDELGDERMAFDPHAEQASWAMLQVFLDQCFKSFNR